VEPQLRKRFGQNFLVDQYVIDRIIDLIAPSSSDHILEIGPGGGVLTAALVSSGADLVAVEIDRDLSQNLVAQYAQENNFLLYCEDILGFDFERLTQRATSWKIVGNLPYNISTPLIMRLLENSSIATEMTFLLQREVAQRLTAGPGSKAYGRLGIMAQRRASISCRLDVAAQSFVPAPKVASTVVQFAPYTKQFDPNFEQHLAEIVRAAFSQRRKTVANALRQHVSHANFEACGIDPRCRAEVLSIDDFEALASASLKTP